MRAKLSLVTAIAGRSMLFAGLVWESAQATPLPLLKSDANSGIVFVGHGGGHGGGWGRWRPWRTRLAWRSPHMGHMNRGPMSGGYYASKRGGPKHDYAQ